MIVPHAIISIQFTNMKWALLSLHGPPHPPSHVSPPLSPQYIRRSTTGCVCLLLFLEFWFSYSGLQTNKQTNEAVTITHSCRLSLPPWHFACFNSSNCRRCPIIGKTEVKGSNTSKLVQPASLQPVDFLPFIVLAWGSFSFFRHLSVQTFPQLPKETVLTSSKSSSWIACSTHACTITHFNYLTTFCYQEPGCNDHFVQGFSYIGALASGKWIPRSGIPGSKDYIYTNFNTYC